MIALQANNHFDGRDPFPMPRNFPSRTKQHVSETASLKLLRAQIPDEWVVRELGERDYGTDITIEIVRDGSLTGDVIVGQVKGVQGDPMLGAATFKKISSKTVNYLIGQPAPAFLFVVSHETGTVHWRSLREHYREMADDNQLTNIKLRSGYDLSSSGLLVLDLIQLSERAWNRVEPAVVSALMFFAALGPLTLGCWRYPPHQPIPSSVQQLLMSHFDANEVIQRYLLRSGKRYAPLWEFYAAAAKAGHLDLSLRFTGKAAQDFVSIFMSDYIRAIAKCHDLTRNVQRRYWTAKYPFQMRHIDAFPPYFVDEDWFARYWFDEYGSETAHISLDFFTDVDENTRRDFLSLTEPSAR